MKDIDIMSKGEKREYIRELEGKNKQLKEEKRLGNVPYRIAMKWQKALQDIKDCASKHCNDTWWNCNDYIHNTAEKALKEK